MIDRDEVVAACAVAIRNHAHEIDAAFRSWLSAPSEATEWGLRTALVLQSLGAERTAHDGSTLDARIDAAKRALAAWDGPTDCEIRLNGTVVRCAKGTAIAAEWQVSNSGAACYATDTRSMSHEPTRALFAALARGMRGEAAVRLSIDLMRESHALQIADQTARRAVEAAEAQKAAAAMTLAAERARHRS